MKPRKEEDREESALDQVFHAAARSRRGVQEGEAPQSTAGEKGHFGVASSRSAFPDAGTVTPGFSKLPQQA
jgi:hypothetical protein